MKKRHGIVTAAYLLLVNDREEILLLRRFNTGYEDGNYSVPAGHVDRGEPVQTGLVREAKEEVGVDLTDDDFELVHVMHRGDSNHSDERMDFFFVCKKWNGDIENMEPHKCDNLSWFSRDNLPKNTIGYIRDAIENAFGGVLYSQRHW